MKGVINSINLLNCCEIHNKIIPFFLRVRIDYPVFLMISLSFIVITLSKSNNILVIDDVSSIGLIITYIVSMSNMTGMFVFTMTSFMTEMSAVERIHEYENWKVHEKSFSEPQPPKNWPQRATINIQNLNIRYRKGLPLVIKNLNLKIEDFEKVAIIGRTGSGKSTLMLALLRIIEYQPGESRIEISGKEITQMGLHHVRHAITIIPQEPYLFPGTLRQNLDPLRKKTDQELLEILGSTQLLKSLTETQQVNTKNHQDKLLDIKIAKSGSNLSMGQKQLISLTRAIIEEPKILLMDEATSNIDQKTDHEIQTMLRTKFKETTILTIAHRLETIMDYDKIVVMD